MTHYYLIGLGFIVTLVLINVIRYYKEVLAAKYAFIKTVSYEGKFFAGMDECLKLNDFRTRQVLIDRRLFSRICGFRSQIIVSSFPIEDYKTSNYRKIVFYKIREDIHTRSSGFQSYMFFSKGIHMTYFCNHALDVMFNGSPRKIYVYYKEIL